MKEKKEKVSWFQVSSHSPMFPGYSFNTGFSPTKRVNPILLLLQTVHEDIYFTSCYTSECFLRGSKLLRMNYSDARNRKCTALSESGK